MKKVIVLFVGIIFLFSNCTFDECTSKTLYIVSFENFIDKVENNYDEFTSKDWEKADAKFEKLTEECYDKFENKLTDRDKKKIVKYGIKYSFYRIRSGLSLDLNIDNDDVDDFLDNIDKVVDNEKDVTKILDKIKNDKNFKKAAKDFKNGLKNLGKGLDKLGKELEKIFDDMNNSEK
ncbi:MAG TPA: hypothetical protein ENI82_02460 [Bacteroidetes bacterium]|nr:hypothetical protein [Bacteroidota bacterium]